MGLPQGHADGGCYVTLMQFWELAFSLECLLQPTAPIAGHILIHTIVNVVVLLVVVVVVELILSKKFQVFVILPVCSYRQCLCVCEAQSNL